MAHHLRDDLLSSTPSEPRTLPNMSGPRIYSWHPHTSSLSHSHSVSSDVSTIWFDNFGSYDSELTRSASTHNFATAPSPTSSGDDDPFDPSSVWPVDTQHQLPPPSSSNSHSHSHSQQPTPPSPVQDKHSTRGRIGYNSSSSTAHHLNVQQPLEEEEDVQVVQIEDEEEEDQHQQKRQQHTKKPFRSHSPTYFSSARRFSRWTNQDKRSSHSNQSSNSNPNASPKHPASPSMRFASWTCFFPRNFDNM